MEIVTFDGVQNTCKFNDSCKFNAHLVIV